MVYFNNCTSEQDVKKEFKRLCLLLHPDTSGYDSHTDFLTMYDDYKNFSLNNSFTVDSHEFIDAILEHFKCLNNIEVQLVGSFIWLSDIIENSMYLQKETIKSIMINGFRSAQWARCKKKWYYSPSDYVKKSSKQFSFEEIQSRYGVQSSRKFHSKVLS